MGTAGSNRRVDGRFGVFANALLPEGERSLAVCYAQVTVRAVGPL